MNFNKTSDPFRHFHFSPLTDPWPPPPNTISPPSSSRKSVVLFVPVDEVRDAGVDGGGGFKAQFGLGPADVGKGGGHVPALEGLQFLLGFHSQFLFQQGDYLAQVLGAVIAQVENFVGL